MRNKGRKGEGEREGRKERRRKGKKEGKEGGKKGGKEEKNCIQILATQSVTSACYGLLEAFSQDGLCHGKENAGLGGHLPPPFLNFSEFPHRIRQCHCPEHNASPSLNLGNELWGTGKTGRKFTLSPQFSDCSSSRC